MKWSSWHSLMVGIIVVAIALALLSVFASQILSGIIVEIVGAFLGVFAAIVLGEILKSRQDSQLAKRVREDLIAELQRVLDVVKKNIENPTRYEIAYWNASVAGGELRVLERYVRRMLVVAYNTIAIHNAVADRNEEMVDNPDATAIMLDESKKKVIDSNLKVLDIVSEMLKMIDAYRKAD